MVAAAGAGPCAHSTRGAPTSALQNTTGRSPPGPFWCGSTICSTNPAAAAASNALPPRSSIRMPEAAASQWVAETMPKVPRSAGRVAGAIRVLIPEAGSALAGAETRGGGLSLRDHRRGVAQERRLVPDQQHDRALPGRRHRDVAAVGGRDHAALAAADHDLLGRHAPLLGALLEAAGEVRAARDGLVVAVDDDDGGAVAPALADEHLRVVAAPAVAQRGLELLGDPLEHLLAAGVDDIAARRRGADHVGGVHDVVAGGAAADVERLHAAARAAAPQPAHRHRRRRDHRAPHPRLWYPIRTGRSASPSVSRPVGSPRPAARRGTAGA